MHSYRIHTVESAPEASRPALQGLQQHFGLIPNLAATMAESPVLVNGFVGALTNFQKATLTGGHRGGATSGAAGRSAAANSRGPA